MSDEIQDEWHRAVCKELEARVKPRTFLVWVKVTLGEAGQGSATTPGEVDPTAWETVAKSAEGWLEGLDQNAVDDQNPPKDELRLADVVIELTASPKNTKRQGAGLLIGNPYPGVVSFTGSYSTGPAAAFDDET
ncbi:MAG: hypothetical protein ACR2FZ_09060 [Thermoleophilaceae bacterium]